MAQNITVKIAGRPYPVKADSPEQEELIRKAADEINQKFAAYQQKRQDKGVVELLSFAALNVAMAKLVLMGKLTELAKEEVALTTELEGYLENIDKNSR